MGIINNIKAVSKTVQQFALVINELMESGLFRNQNEAFVTIRATMKALRDRITPGEAVHLGGQLPALLRGYYYEGWDFTAQTNSKNKSEFLSDVRLHLGGHDDIDLERSVPVAMMCLLKLVDEGEAQQAVQLLPKEVQECLTH